MLSLMMIAIDSDAGLCAFVTSCLDAKAAMTESDAMSTK